MEPQVYGGGDPLGQQQPARRRGPDGAAAALVLAAALAAVGAGFAISGGGASVGAGARPASADPAADVAQRAVWRTAPADSILPPKLSREGTEAYYRVAVDPKESCSQLPAGFVKALAPAGCVRVVQATYVDSTESVVATVGFVVAGGSAAQRTSLFQNWTADSFARQYALMPSTYPVKASLAAGFGNAQRIAWMSQISNDGTYIAFAVSGFVDGRQGPSASAFDSGNESELQSDSPPVQVAGDLPIAVLDGIGAASKNTNGGAA